jgi:hypothetical protein
MSNSANNMVLTFGSAVAKVNSIGLSEDGNPIDVTSLDNDNNIFEVGTKNIELSVEVVGVNATMVGATGALSVAWNSGNTTVIGQAICTNREINGSLNDRITTSLTFRPYSAS